MSMTFEPEISVGLMSRLFANCPGSIQGRVIPKTKNMVLDATSAV